MMEDYQINRIKDLLITAIKNKDINTVLVCEKALLGEAEAVQKCAEIYRKTTCETFIKGFPGFDN